ncbi:MAG TPA: S8 family serine peptidase [Symbiobacteriaceae bacterium]|nr:S8 family serine peptidase [Symbiobacteriaceae bacterium]
MFIGIDANHKDLQGKVIGWRDFVNDETEPYDDNGHGTHVAGIAAGAGVASPTMKGMAPGAALVGVKVLDGDGSGSFSAVIAGVEWVIENRDRYNIRVMKTELGQVLPTGAGGGASHAA